MKQTILILLSVALTYSGYSQLTVSRSDGGSVITKLSMGIKVNDGSSLKREFITINTTGCPVQFGDIGVTTMYSDPGYRFKPNGNFGTTEPIVAYEIHHVLYDVFGAHMTTLSNQDIIDIEGRKEFDRYSSWYASENDVSEYLVCVSYVANVRTMAGVIWRYNYKDIKAELDKLKIKFEEGYTPKKDKDKEK